MLLEGQAGAAPGAERPFHLGGVGIALNKIYPAALHSRLKVTKTG
jgi:hypothetical protein